MFLFDFGDKLNAEDDLPLSKSILEELLNGNAGLVVKLLQKQFVSLGNELVVILGKQIKALLHNEWGYRWRVYKESVMEDG